MKKCIRVVCQKEHDPAEVARTLGNLSNPFRMGYCSAQCYTKDMTETPEQHPGDLIERGKMFDEMLAALKQTTELLDPRLIVMGTHKAMVRKDALSTIEKAEKL